MKIANIIEEGRFGGPQSRIIAVAEILKDQGIQTLVISQKKGSDIFFKKLKERGITSLKLNLHHLTKEKYLLTKFIFLFFPELFILYRSLKKEQVDIVHCNSSWQYKGVIAAWLAGIKIIWHLNDTKIPAFVMFVFKFLAQNINCAFITAGKEVKLYYLNDQKLLKRPVMEIQAPVNAALFDPNKVKPDKKTASKEGLKIVIVCYINPGKGLEYFIDMASTLNLKYNNLNFFIVGPVINSQKKYYYKLLEQIKKLKIKNIYFYGASDNIASILKATDIFVCSSLAEASPTSVWEAMSMALPIVSTDVGDVAQFVRDGESGFIVPVKDTASLAGKVGVLIENLDLRNKFGNKAREIAIKNLDVNICAEKHAKFYKMILNN